MSSKLQAVIRHLRQAAIVSSLTERTDAELLHQYVAEKDEAAFSVLARRHGPMIHAVCSRVLGCAEDVEDAVQATLLVLARKAAAIHKHHALASWLHGVAHRIALNARKCAARRQVYERCGEMPSTEPPDRQAVLHELQAILDDEVRRLPEKYRAPFVLCCLEGKSKSEAAAELGWKEGTVSGRLAQARERLRGRLARRGIGLPAALCALALGQDTVSASVASATIQRVLLSATGKTGGVSVLASTLAEGVLQTMATVKLRWALALVMAGTLTALGAGLTTLALPAVQQTAVPSEEHKTAEPAPRTDLFGDPLPPGALTRMGTIRFAQGDSIDGSPALAPDHKTFATVSRQTPYRQGRTVCLWDAATGKEVGHLDDPDFENYQVFFLKRENLLGTLGISRKPVQGDTHAYVMQLWDPKTGKKTPAPLQVLGYHFEPWALSADERRLVSASRQPPVEVRDRKSGNVLAKWEGDGARIYSLDFTPDGTTVVIGTETTIHIWDWKANRESNQLSGIPKQTVRRFCFAPHDRWIGGIDKEGLRIWDKKNVTEVRRFAGEHDIRFFPDGKRFLSATTGAIWDIPSGREIGRLENCANCLALDISADGREVAGYAQGRIRRWDAATGKDRSPPAPSARRMMIHQLGFVANGKAVVSASPDGAIRVWDAATGKELRTLVEGTEWDPQRSKPIFLRVAADGTIVTARGKSLSFFKHDGKGMEIDLDAEVASLNLSSDGKTLIVAMSNRLVQMWDIASKKMVTRCTVPEGTGLEALNVSADRKRISTYVNRAVVLLNASGAVEQTLEKRPEQTGRNGAKGYWGDDGYSYFPGIQAFAFSPNGDILASAGHLRCLKLLDVRSGKARHVLTPPIPKYHRAELRNVAFSPNGRMIAAESAEGVVDVWETSTGQRRRRFLGHRSYQTSLAFAPDGVRLATGNRDATILIWDVFGLWTGKAVKAAPLTENELPGLWTRLRDGDAEQACGMMARLMGNPTISAPFLKRHLLDRKNIETARLRTWIADLDAESFAQREKASKELANHLAAAEPLLQECLANKPSLEVRRRIEELLARADSHPLSPETIRDLRALEVLEYFGRAALEEVARQLAEGNHDPHIIAAARSACQRQKDRRP